MSDLRSAVKRLIADLVACLHPREARSGSGEGGDGRRGAGSSGGSGGSALHGRQGRLAAREAGREGARSGGGAMDLAPDGWPHRLWPPPSIREGGTSASRGIGGLAEGGSASEHRAEARGAPRGDEAVLGREARVALRGERANGGPVLPKTTYLVGERGPELFVPSGAGSILPNDRLIGSLGALKSATARRPGRAADVRVSAGEMRLEGSVLLASLARRSLRRSGAGSPTGLFNFGPLPSPPSIDGGRSRTGRPGTAARSAV